MHHDMVKIYNPEGGGIEGFYFLSDVLSAAVGQHGSISLVIKGASTALQFFINSSETDEDSTLANAREYVELVASGLTTPSLEEIRFICKKLTRMSQAVGDEN